MSSASASATTGAVEPRYGGLHLRVAAGIVDVLFSQGLWFLLIVVWSSWTTLLDLSRLDRPLASWIGFAILWLYFVTFESSSRRATPGKLLLGLVVIVDDGSGRGITFPRAAMRFLFKVIAVFSVAGVLAIAFNRRKRGLHDVLAGTLVVVRGTEPTAEGARDARRRLPPSLVAIAALAAVLSALVLWQYSASKEDSAAQRRCLLDLQGDIAKAHAAGRKWGQFQEEVARLDKELSIVERLLPARLDVEGFRETLKGELAAKGIQARIVGVKTFRRGRLFRAELQLEMAGEPAAIADALQGGCCGGRLTSWNGSFTDAGVSGALSTYAVPPPPDAAAVPCAPRRGDLFLWPFTRRAEELAREIALARTELAPLSETVRAVHRYERTKRDLDERIEMVNAIRAPGKNPGPEREEPVPPETADRPAVRS